MFVAGAYEFLADDGSDPPDAKAWKPLVQFFDKLGYAAGGLSKAEGKALAERGLAPPGNWFVLDSKEIRSKIVEVPTGKIGLLFFPELAKQDAAPSPDFVRAIEREAAKLRPQVNLVVGVSPWGVNSESEYLEAAKPVLDVLLGSGPGVGFSARVAGKGKTLWMHTYNKGKALYEVDLPAWPGSGDFRWEAGKNFASQAVILDDAYAPVADVEAMFQGIPDPNDKQDK